MHSLPHTISKSPWLKCMHDILHNVCRFVIERLDHCYCLVEVDTFACSPPIFLIYIAIVELFVLGAAIHNSLWCMACKWLRALGGGAWCAGWGERKISLFALVVDGNSVLSWLDHDTAWIAPNIPWENNRWLDVRMILGGGLWGYWCRLWLSNPGNDYENIMKTS